MTMRYADYDSTQDTQAHIDRVRDLLGDMAVELGCRARDHDASKLQDPEKVVFDRCTPRLRGLSYGSKEYDEAKAELGDALRHHYARNRHHPEYHPEGILGMNLIDLLEMLVDWKAATERHDDGCIRRSLEVNAVRFQIPEALLGILRNTVEYMHW